MLSKQSSARPRLASLLLPPTAHAQNPLAIPARQFLDETFELLQWLSQKSRSVEGRQRIDKLTTAWDTFSDLVDGESNHEEDF